MLKDRGKTKLLKATGKRVTTTGQMLWFKIGHWNVEIEHKDGSREWVKESDLSDIEQSNGS